MEKTFVGLGFGPIQAGLFMYEAFRSGNFKRLVTAEIMPEVIKAVRDAGGRFWVNVAEETGVVSREIPGVEIYNPRVAEDRDALIAAIAESDEMASALPSVQFYGKGEPGSVVYLLAEGLERKAKRGDDKPCVIYTAENHNHAAEILDAAVASHIAAKTVPFKHNLQCLNTVIGKMSGVVTEKAHIHEQSLKFLAPKTGRCFLVEEFNRILISRIRSPEYRRGMDVFEEKDDLLPFEEAKLYGHNAVHALIGYLGRLRGYKYMTDLRDDPELREFAWRAALDESGAALCRKHAGIDDLFTPKGFEAYMDDLLARMTNPHLRDGIERITRDPRRKLGWDDRLVGAMRLALDQEITPERFAVAAAAALEMLREQENKPDETLLGEAWLNSDASLDKKVKITRLIQGAGVKLAGFRRERK